MWFYLVLLDKDEKNEKECFVVYSQVLICYEGR